MRAAFLHFDKDNSGTISREELREALKVGTGGGVPTGRALPMWHNQSLYAILSVCLATYRAFTCP